MNTVRITSGRFKGQKLVTPGEGTHPMGERERLALFNMLAPELVSATVMDAYAGSGALGIEALSRGASKVVFVEKARKAGEIIRQNTRNLGLDEEIIIGDVAKLETDERFDIILADPPYDNFDPKILLHLVEFLKPAGLLVLSHPGEIPDIENFTPVKSHKYAKAHITLYRKKDQNE